MTSRNWSETAAVIALIHADIPLNAPPVRWADLLQTEWKSSRSTTYSRIAKLRAWIDGHPQQVDKLVAKYMADPTVASDVPVVPDGGLVPDVPVVPASDVVATSDATVMPAVEPEPAVDVEALAAALLRQVIDAATSPARIERDLHGIQARLATALEENARMRRKLGEAEDLLHARKVELDGLRSRVIAAETSARESLLKLNGTATAVLGAARERELRELARDMSQPPSPTKAINTVVVK